MHGFIARPAYGLTVRLAGLIEILLMTLCLGLVGYAGLLLSHHLGRVATIWPANGILLGILLTTGRHRWAFLIALGVVVNVIAALVVGYTAMDCMRLAVINIAEICLAIGLLQRNGAAFYDLSDPKTLAGFTVAAVMVSPFVATVLNGLLLLATVGQASIPRLVATYFAHALGVAALTPMVLLVRQGALSRLFGWRMLARTLTALGVVLGVSTLVFAQSRYPLLFLVYPPLVLAVLLIGVAGAAFGLFFVSVVSIGLTVSGHGPLALVHSPDIVIPVLIIQLFLSVAALLVFMLAAVLEDRNRAEAKLQRAHDQLAAIATTDSLTGLTNRRGLDKALDTACRRANRDGGPISLLLIDVDHFKLFNDHYGHQAGDECLRNVAGIVAQFERRPGDCTARFGGEEFIVVLAPASAEAAKARAEALRMRIEDAAITHVKNETGGEVVTVSIGVATIDPNREAATAALLLARADGNLYEAKRGGRNRVVAAAVMGIPVGSDV
jgi:diguanylate cyclase (GGDEF)-like protein